MRLNDGKRKMLQGSMIRVQDVALVLHTDLERAKTANEEYHEHDLEAKVLAMFSAISPPGEHTVHGIISAASRLSEPVLLRMVELPIAIPLWVFRDLMPSLPSLMRLSRKFPLRSIITSFRCLKRASCPPPTPWLAFTISLALAGYVFFAAEHKLLAVSALVVSPSVENRAPLPVKEICFRHEIMPCLSFKTWESLEFEEFCSRLHNTLPVQISLSLSQAVIFSGWWYCYNSPASYM